MVNKSEKTVRYNNLSVASRGGLVTEVTPDSKVFTAKLSDQCIHCLNQLLVMYLDVNVDGGPGELTEYIFQQWDPTFCLAG